MSEKQECICDWHMRMRDPNPDCRANHDDGPSPHPPTREQIAEALYLDDADHEDEMWAQASTLQRDAYLKNADAIIALIRNGADR